MYALLSNMVWVCYSETWSELRKQQWYYSSGLKNISYCLYSPAIPLLLWKILKFETFYSPKYCSPWETFLGQLKLIFILAVYCSILYMSDRSNWFVELFKSPILLMVFFFFFGLLVVSNTEIGILKSPARTVNVSGFAFVFKLFSSWFWSSIIYCIYTYLFCFWWTDPIIIHKVPHLIPDDFSLKFYFLQC